MISLGDDRGTADAVSADGLTIAGSFNFGLGNEAATWTAGGGWVGLGDLPGGIHHSFVRDISGDGSIVVGQSETDAGRETFIWDTAHGMRRLQDVLAADYGLDLDGWDLVEALGISSDGLAIVGSGINPAGDHEAWIATIPEPSTAALLALGLVGIAMRRRRSGRSLYT
jgi:uncharacterized membrane protein